MIGWREWVALPELTPEPIKAKIDTGAVTSSLHALDMELVTGETGTVARFGLQPHQGTHASVVDVEVPIVGFKKVRSSNGRAELRPLIRTPIALGDTTFEVDITLASRDAMGFRMLLGRRALKRRFWIDPSRSFLQTSPSESLHH